MAMVLKRCGQLMRNKEGSLVLVNEEKEGFLIDEVIAFVWVRAKDISREELVKNISKELNISEEKINNEINTIVDKLKEAKLLKEEE
ncbi:MAG: PqqD family peptide modification chaperone [Candidatus Aenigmarchaeota archaeon]|nr:PqqD family protein [Candidatus Aenigmarchaeota archaeon]MDW8149367.1 PqqD family peptide modification chaperone [Candidatus Aenigmarchaeota archaeon]